MHIKKISKIFAKEENINFSDVAEREKKNHCSKTSEQERENSENRDCTWSHRMCEQECECALCIIDQKTISKK